MSTSSYSAFCCGCRTGYLTVPANRICVICRHDVVVRKPELIACPHCGMRFNKPVYGADNSASCPICFGRLRLPLTAQKYKENRKPSKMSTRFPWLNEKTARLLVLIAERDEWVCGICGKVVDWKIGDPRKRRPTLDHVHPRSRGGRNVRENLQLAHADCNNLKGDDPAPGALTPAPVKKDEEWPF